MRVFAMIPVGPLDRFGYQNNLHECIGSVAAWADSVLLVQSTRNNAGVAELMTEYSNIELISNFDTWFMLCNSGEWYDLDVITDNLNIGVKAAQDRGADVCVISHSNWYIPAHNVHGLLQRCDGLLKSGKAWDWIYRGDQLGETLLYANTRMPNIVNLDIEHDWHFVPVDIITDGTESYHIEHGDYREFDNESFIDVALEISRRDLADKINENRCYHEYMPKRKPTFEWDYWFDYYVKKFRQKPRSGHGLCYIGKQIANNGQLHYVSRQVLEAIQ